LHAAVERALNHYREPDTWQQIMDTGMQQDFSWKRSAKGYIELYEKVLDARPA
jgi:starch synthase